MNKNFNISQAIVILLAVSAVFGLYFFGQTKPSEKSLAKKAEQTVTESAVQINLQELRNTAESLLTDNEATQWNTLSTNGNTNEIVSFWTSIDRNDIAATYAKENAEELNNYSSWNFTGDLFVRGYRELTDTSYSKYYITEAITAYEKALALESNTETQLKLAKMHTEISGDVMQGVVLLRDLVEKNPNHIQGNFELGLLAIQSGQTDKAIERFEKLNQLQPDFIEPYILKAQLEIQQSNKSGALITIDKAISNTTDAEKLDALRNIKNTIINN